MKFKIILYLLILSNLAAAARECYSSLPGNGSSALTFSPGSSMVSIPIITPPPVIISPPPVTRTAGVTLKGKGKETYVVDAATEEPVEPPIVIVQESDSSNPYLPGFLQPVAKVLNKVLP